MSNVTHDNLSGELGDDVEPSRPAHFATTWVLLQYNLFPFAMIAVIALTMLGR